MAQQQQTTLPGQQPFPPPPQPQAQQLPPGAPPLPPIQQLLGRNDGPIPSAAAEGGQPRQRQPDKIANTSDLYLETLKFDTATRQRALQRGDTEEANAVFKDPRINQLKETLKPYLESEVRKKAQEEGTTLSTSEDEMIFFSPFYKRDRGDMNPSNSGISYREKMKQRLGKKDVDALDAQAVVPADTAGSGSPAVPQDQKTAAPVAPQVAVAVAPAEPSITTTTAAATEVQFDEQYENVSRSKIRTLMGFLLKHRGGPGFGSGRLKNPIEISRFESTLAEVIEVLKQESGLEQADLTVSDEGTLESKTDGAPLNVPLASTLACAEAAIAAYKEASTKEMLVSLRDALLHAAQTCSAVVASNPIAQATVASTPTVVAMEPVVAKTSPVSTPASMKDKNTQVLENAYNMLQNIAGDETYGIKTGLTSQQVSVHVNYCDLLLEYL